MSVTRRQFLLSTAGAAVGAIIPSFYYRALEHFERFGEALLLAPSRATQDLCVLDTGDCIQLCLGDPFAEPPPMTYREYIMASDPASLDDLEGTWGIEECHLDTEIDEDYVMDLWQLTDGPAARGYSLLKSLDLGAALRGPNAVGGIDLVEESNMIWTWRYATPHNEVSLSLLQQRLNDLETGIRVVTGYAL